MSVPSTFPIAEATFKTLAASTLGNRQALTDPQEVTYLSWAMKGLPAEERKQGISIAYVLSYHAFAIIHYCDCDYIEDCRLVAIVKLDSYGHGGIEINTKPEPSDILAALTIQY